MTDEEIIESFRRAKFPAKQVGILSELTLRPKADIIEVLEGAGFDRIKVKNKRFIKGVRLKPDDADSEDFLN